MAKGKQTYVALRDERFVRKTVRISETIIKTKLKMMNSLHIKTKKVSAKEAVHDRLMSERTIEISRDRGMTITELLTYNVAPSPFGLMTKPEKWELLNKLEANLYGDQDYTFQHHTIYSTTI